MAPTYAHQSADGRQSFASAAGKVVWGGVFSTERRAFRSLKKFQEIK